MKVMALTENSNKQGPYVVIKPPRKKILLQSPCDWVIMCPFESFHESAKTMIQCFECPANSEKTKMTYTEAIEWWEKQL